MNNQGDNPQAGQGRPLPKKEQDLFKSVVKHYETKQYKKSVKAADAILKRFPKHGETLCMKGLTLNCMEKKDEALTLVKQGLMNDVRSHVCWHVYGLLYRSERNYNEAIKAYKQALRIDPENLQILRDLSLLQIQMRDLSGFAVTRHTILTLKSNQRINWLTFALAKHLTGDLRDAISVIDIYLGTLEAGSPELERGYESGELTMYRNSILAEIPGNTQEALDHLIQCKNVVVDEGNWLKAKASYELHMGMFDAARETYLTIFKRGETEDYCAHTGYMCALLELNAETCAAALKTRGTATVATMMPLSTVSRKKILDAYRSELFPLMPRSHAVKRIPFALLEGEELKTELDSYCRKNLRKGVPSLGLDLCSLFLVEKNGRLVHVKDPIDVKSHPIFQTIVSLVDGYSVSLTSQTKFPGDDEKEELPSTVLWTWYLKAQLYELSGDYSEGLELTEKCLEHTPTAVDVYELKARLLKASGDIVAAADCLDAGRELDKQDRYINNQTTKYLLQANRDEVAKERISLFTRHEGDPERNLFDMQCTWYELELAACLGRKGDWGKCLKKYMAVEKHFEDFHEDQFDFHSYCIRKVTLRSYISVLRWEDELWGQSIFGSAVEGIIGAFLHLHDNPLNQNDNDEPDYSSMTAAQKKKAKALARKKKKAAEKKVDDEGEKNEEELGKDENGKNKNKKLILPVIKDEDPNGEELLKMNPLEEARKYVSKLSMNAPHRFSTWILQYDVAIRRGKFLMAMQALFKAKALDPNSSELFSRIVDFFQKSPPITTDTNAAVNKVLATEQPRLLDGKSVSEYVSDAASIAKADPLTSLPLRIAIAKSLVTTKSSSVAEASSLIVDGGLSGRGVTVESCREALACLKTFGDEANSTREIWIVLVKNRFPLIKFFE